MNSPFRRARRAEATYEDFAAEAGVPVADFMREVAEFRVALEADMTIAAAAVELGAPEIASSVIGSDRDHLAAFESRAMRSISPARSAPTLKPTHLPVRRTRLAMAAALALITALGGALSYTERPSTNKSVTSNLALAAAARYAQFSALATGDASAAQMIEAAARLHQTLADLVSQNPASANQVADILRSEQQQLLRWLPPGTTTVLADAKALVARMRASAPAKAAAVLDQVNIASPPPQSNTGTGTSTSTSSGSHPTAHPTPKPTAAPSPAPEPHPTTTPSSPKPSPKPSDMPSASSSPAPSSSPVFPGTPRNPFS